jgi:hypothetical protein
MPILSEIGIRTCGTCDGVSPNEGQTLLDGLTDRNSFQAHSWLIVFSTLGPLDQVGIRPE